MDIAAGHGVRRDYYGAVRGDLWRLYALFFSYPASASAGRRDFHPNPPIGPDPALPTTPDFTVTLPPFLVLIDEPDLCLFLSTVLEGDNSS